MYSLQECKSKIETNNSVLFEDIYISDAERYKKDLEQLGASIKLDPTKWDDPPKRIPSGVTFDTYLNCNKIVLTPKQKECCLLIFDRIIGKYLNNNLKYTSISGGNKEYYIFSSLRLDVFLWDYVVEQTFKYEKLYLFT